MRKVVLIFIFILVTNIVSAQSKSVSAFDVKIGLGASLLGSGDVLIGKVEGEFTKKWNRFLSNSLSLNFGYRGANMLYGYYRGAFTTHLDGNVFLSPFRNDKFYNLKLGTGLSQMYVSDLYPKGYRYIYYTSRAKERFSLGFSMILENEIIVSKKNIFGLKAMIQPYLNGDIATSVMLKIGRKL